MILIDGSLRISENDEMAIFVTSDTNFRIILCQLDYTLCFPTCTLQTHRWGLDDTDRCTLTHTMTKVHFSSLDELWAVNLNSV